MSALEASGSNEALGLDAFATEAPPAPDAARPSAASAGGQRIALIVLAVLVAIEAVPAALWVRSRLAPMQPVTTVAAAPIAPTPLPVEAVATAPCAPTASAQAAAAPAATTGNGDTVKAAAPRPAPGLVAGLVAITAPVPMHVYADGRLVGTTEAETIMLPVGQHDVELVSEAVGFRARRSVTVEAGRTSTVRIDPPRVPVHINAIPWAEVWVDNQRVGETPIGNLQQTIGSHEVIFRHPELGERRMVVVVTMKEPARISMDLRKR